MNITPEMIDWHHHGYGSVVVVTVDGERYSVEIEDDYDCNPREHGDCYTDEDIDAWERGAWRYVGVIVTPLSVPDGVQYGLSESLSGVEFDFPIHNAPDVVNGRRFMRSNEDYTLMVHPVPDMISEVQRAVARYRRDLAWESYALS